VAVRLPLPLVKVREELQPEVEHLTRRQVACAGVSNQARWCLPGQKMAVERPRVRTRQGEAVQLDSYARLQHNGGPSTSNRTYRVL
jgi:hypothetical protein